MFGIYFGNREKITAKSFLFVTKYVITQKIAYVPIGPTKHSSTFCNVLSSNEKKPRTNPDAKVVVMKPLMKPAKLIFPS